MVGPTASLSSLNRADGSAAYKCPATGYEVLGAVNAPIELPARRDALKPEEATVEVFVKPGNSMPGVGERYVEGILRSVLAEVILGRERGFPRRGVVITLAVISGKPAERGDNYLTLLPALLHASLLALLSAAVPLSMTFSTALLGVNRTGTIIQDPLTADADVTSLHVLAFSSKGQLLLNESEGRFDFETWETIREHAASVCRGRPSVGSDGDVAMGDKSDDTRLDGFVRETVEDRLHHDHAWKFHSN
ncbi:Exoribonuclease phosphorolytic domain 2 [Penicillium capsulatum]|uniref:Exoribonuclease phosphorolytic domain 2 n=1 Tax=Penicillium capsulatum TaxID=69766 RepID=A0A9W9HS34_9EURO|nr:Exoribonuclease phosphorolytic domain 2 [Penicillium capsulatum]KAJ6105573.1 Exoribonuclease phosphorolytic domain 2 [Penicillium capsulatum]